MSLSKIAAAAGALLVGGALAARGVVIEVPYPRALAQGPLDGRLLLLISPPGEGPEPRFATGGSYRSAQLLGLDVEAWRPSAGSTCACAASGGAFSR